MPLFILGILLAIILLIRVIYQSQKTEIDTQAKVWEGKIREKIREKTGY